MNDEARLAIAHRRPYRQGPFRTPAKAMQIHVFLEDRRALLGLFALADDSPTQISNYLPLGEVLVARDPKEVIGHVQIVETDEPCVFEIKSLAVIEQRQGEGIGRRLIEAAVSRCRQRNARRLIAATAAADIDNLRFYQRQGFRMYRIVRDVFVPANGYAEGTTIDGIGLRDQVLLDLDLR